jgi:hypothetical protein
MHVRENSFIFRSYFVWCYKDSAVAKIVKAYNDFLNGVKSQNLIQKSFIFDCIFRLSIF